MEASDLSLFGFIVAVLLLVLFIAVVGWISSIRQSVKKMEKMMEQQNLYLGSISVNLVQLLNLNRPQREPPKPPTV